MAFSGLYAPVPSGKTSRSATRPIKPASAAPSSGCAPASSSASSGRWPLTCASAGAGSLGVFHRRHLCGGEKRGLGVGTTKRGKGTKLMAVADRTGLPVAVHVASASPHQVPLVEATLTQCVVEARPEHVIGAKAYDSEPPDACLAECGIELIAPHRSNRKKPKTQDGRPLRRYKRRWKVERVFAWLQHVRRLLVRHEADAGNYLGFVQLGCTIILLRCYL